MTALLTILITVTALAAVIPIAALLWVIFSLVF